MSKTIHFQDQLAATNNPDPVLMFGIIHEGEMPRMSMYKTKKSHLHEDLIGMRFDHMEGVYPFFVNELVEA